MNLKKKKNKTNIYMTDSLDIFKLIIIIICIYFLLSLL